MAKLELTGRVKHLHRMVLQEKSPYVVRVELDCQRKHRPQAVAANGRPLPVYELEFFVDDEEASRLRPDKPIRISLAQD